MRRISFIKLWFLAAVLVLSCGLAAAQTNEFTYQGKLTDSGTPSVTYDFEFRLCPASFPLSCNPPLETKQRLGVSVSNGIFTVKLDFDAVHFNGAERFLEISVRRNSGEAWTPLNPRQKITSSPYSIKSLNAASADLLSAACVLCVTDAQIQTVDGGKVTGTVLSATTANNVSGVVQIANGGTGSVTQNFVDLSTNQSNIGGNKTFTGVISGDGAGLTNVPGTLKWQSVPGTSQQAQSNNGYLTVNAAQTIVTLPTAPNVGDVVRVSASGAGGWKIAQNAGQSILVSNISGTGLIAGVNWTPRESNRTWQSVASSADGNKLVAVVQAGLIYTSTNAGINWTARESNRLWFGVASSANGTKLVAAAYDGQLYTSTDSGVSWTARESNRFWSGVASSADGTKLVAVVSDGQIYTSSDSGATWTPRDSNRQWTTVASSADGNKLAAVVFTGKIYTSSDSGVTWVPRENDRFWRGIASSADGTKLVAGDDGGRIYTSTDSGVSWTPRESNRRWWAFTSSADGNILVALVTSGQIYTSTDSGVTWTPRDSSRFWQSAASSADGNKLVAVARQIYTSIPSTASGVAGFLTGGQYTSIELQYTGDGQFIPISHSGAISGF